MVAYSLPTNLPVTSPYGPRPSGFHSGIDYSDGNEGHPIRACADGVVTYAGFDTGGLGNTVTLTHPDGNKSGYGHMLHPAAVSHGQQVTRGQVVGYVGNTGASRGNHLHLWMGQNPNTLAVNPNQFLGGASAPTEGDDVTPEQMAELGRWMKEQRELLEKTVGQWLKDVEARLGAKIDAD